MQDRGGHEGWPRASGEGPLVPGWGRTLTDSGGRPKRVLAMSDARRLCQDSDAKAFLSRGG